MFTWKLVDYNYLDYLRSNEGRIPFTDYGSNKLKPFFGSLFVVGNLMYVTQISSPKPRHNQIKQSLDFIKLYDGSNLLGVVNLNYMFPVPQSLVTDLRYSNIGNYITFSNPTQKSKYISLLKKELNIIQSKPISQNAATIYKLKETQPNHPISQRSFNFKQLEILAENYIK